MNVKTDWAVRYDEKGRYVGDHFTAEDYQRIKENIEELRRLGEDLYEVIEYQDIQDVTTESFYDERTINALEQAIEAIRTRTFDPGIPPAKTWNGNDPAPLADDYNRIERGILLLYEVLTRQALARKRLAITLGGVQF